MPLALQGVCPQAQLPAAGRTIASVKAGIPFYVEQLNLMLLEEQKSK